MKKKTNWAAKQAAKMWPFTHVAVTKKLLAAEKRGFKRAVKLLRELAAECMDEAQTVSLSARENLLESAEEIRSNAAWLEEQERK